MSDSYQAGLGRLLSHIEGVLSEQPEGMTEYALIEALNQRGLEGFDNEFFASNLTMFQSHFLLFHSLYALDERLRSEGRGSLTIHCLKIQWLPYKLTTQSQELAGNDPMRAYYMDLDNLNDTDAEEVERLLSGFWERFVCNDEHDHALQQLGLCAPVSFEEIRLRYRKLVMEHHPDRGGDLQRLQVINKAMAVLEVIYK